MGVSGVQGTINHIWWVVAGHGEKLSDSVWGFEFSIFFFKKRAFGIHITGECMLLLYIEGMDSLEGIWEGETWIYSRAHYELCFASPPCNFSTKRCFLQKP